MTDIADLFCEISGLACHPQTKALCDEARARIQRVPTSDFALLQSGGLDVSLLQSAARNLKGRAQAAAASAATAVPLNGRSSAFPTADYPLFCGSERPDADIVLAAQIALQAAELVWSAASRACEQVTVICPFPGGGNTSLACIPADALLFAAKAVLADFIFCIERIDSAEIEAIYDRVGAVSEQNCEAIRLLNTSEPFRSSNLPSCADHPGFPYVWPENP